MIIMNALYFISFWNQTKSLMGANKHVKIKYEPDKAFPKRQNDSQRRKSSQDDVI